MGSHLGCSIIPGGIPSGIPLKKGGIPPGRHLGSQLGLAGSHLIFLPGMLMLMLMLMRLCLCLCTSENSIRQISGFVLLFMLMLMSRVFSLA